MKPHIKYQRGRWIVTFLHWRMEARYISWLTEKWPHHWLQYVHNNPRRYYTSN